MKTLFLALATLALAAIVITGAGFLLPAQREGRAEAVIAAPSTRILAVIADVEAQPVWRAGVASVRRTPGGWTETTARGETIAFTAAEMTGTRIRLRFAGAGCSGIWEAGLVPEADGTRVSVRELVVVAGPVARILSRLLFDPQEFAARYLAELKARSEGGAGG